MHAGKVTGFCPNVYITAALSVNQKVLMPRDFTEPQPWQVATGMLSRFSVLAAVLLMVLEFLCQVRFGPDPSVQLNGRW